MQLCVLQEKSAYKVKKMSLSTMNPCKVGKGFLKPPSLPFCAKETLDVPLAPPTGPPCSQAPCKSGWWGSPTTWWATWDGRQVSMPWGPT